MINKYILGIVVSAVLGSQVVAESVPTVPVSVVAKREQVEMLAQKNSQSPVTQSQLSAVSSDPKINAANSYTAEKGQALMIVIGKYHTNRIVTPFAKVAVDTAAKAAEVTIKDNVVLVATNGTAPVSLFIREYGSQDVSINLVLIPKEVPPAELTLSLGDSYQSGTSVLKRPVAKRWEKSMPFAEMLEKLFTSIVVGEVPPGYRFHNVADLQSRPLSVCKQKNLIFDFDQGQLVDGHNLSVLVGTVRNVSTEAVEFIESNCDNWNVASIAAWPEVYLQPGQTSEVLIAFRQNKEPQRKIERPSLLGGKQ